MFPFSVFFNQEMSSFNHSNSFHISASKTFMVFCLCLQDYLGCIIDCSTLPLKPEQVSTLFCNIEDIYEFNR